ncbi:MAG: hypothetical protein JW757_01030 [Anaerolineales bacterium]|nr:hypothetical protein [Anaerolineales bacterium]
MAQKKKKGSAPRSKEPVKRKKSLNQILFSVFAVFMVLLMVVPYLLSLLQ